MQKKLAEGGGGGGVYWEGYLLLVSELVLFENNHSHVEDSLTTKPVKNSKEKI